MISSFARPACRSLQGRPLPPPAPTTTEGVCRLHPRGEPADHRRGNESRGRGVVRGKAIQTTWRTGNGCRCCKKNTTFGDSRPLSDERTFSREKVLLLPPLHVSISKRVLNFMSPKLCDGVKKLANSWGKTKKIGWGGGSNISSPWGKCGVREGGIVTSILASANRYKTKE